VANALAALAMYAFDDDRLDKLRTLHAEGVPAWPVGWEVLHTSEELRKAAQGLEPAPGAEGDTPSATPPPALESLGEFRIAGRLLFKNDMGKAGFGRLLDRGGRMQIYVRREEVGEAAHALFKKLDLGDIVGVRGVLMRTRTGELTLQASELVLLTKCLRSLPDKWHGVTDPEVRQRQRYLDLLVSEEVRETFQRRSRAIRWIRDFLEARGFLEVETPMMQAIPGGATARPFVTHHNALDVDLYLRIAPELYLKRLVVGGLERVFEINRNFRNEGIDSTHNPEFTMLEFYQAHATWQDLAAMTEVMLRGVVADVCGSDVIAYQGATLAFDAPFRRLRYEDAVRDAVNGRLAAVGREDLSLAGSDTRDLAKLHAAWRAGYAREVEPPASVARTWEAVFDADVEKTLVSPTFVTHFPIELSPLARRNDADPWLADRFELFIAGREIANGFNELNDPVDQAARFEAQARLRQGGDAEAMYFDEDYVTALTYGLPPTAGEGIGIDRLVMLLTDSASIRDVILFPTLRPRS
jgi:lysyl-tRNA synthetase class 2